MQTMRYINLLDKASHVKTQKCFAYNNTIFFAVPHELVSKAIGPAAVNVKRMQENLGRKIRIISEPRGILDIRRFLEDVVAPHTFKSLEMRNGEVIITAGNNQTKAILIGRNRRRYEELQQIIRDIFLMELKIV